MEHTSLPSTDRHTCVCVPPYRGGNTHDPHGVFRATEHTPNTPNTPNTRPVAEEQRRGGIQSGEGQRARSCPCGGDRSRRFSNAGGWTQHPTFHPTHPTPNPHPTHTQPHHGTAKNMRSDTQPIIPRLHTQPPGIPIRGSRVGCSGTVSKENSSGRSREEQGRAEEFRATAQKNCRQLPHSPPKTSPVYIGGTYAVSRDQVGGVA